MSEDKTPESGEKPWWSEAVKDLTSAGLATIFMTEESVRNYLREKKLPKEIVGLFLDNMKNRKDDLYKIIGKEVGTFLSKVDLSREVSRFLENHRINFEGRVSFEPKNTPSSKSSNKETT